MYLILLNQYIFITTLTTDPGTINFKIWFFQNTGGSEEEDLIHYNYMAILVPPQSHNPCPRDQEFQNLSRGIHAAEHLVFHKICIALKKRFSKIKILYG